MGSCCSTPSTARSCGRPGPRQARGNSGSASTSRGRRCFWTDALPVASCLLPVDPATGNRQLATSNMTYTEQHLREAAAIIGQLDVPSIERMADLLAQLRVRGGRLFLLG